jgi:hypothetical protein
VFLDGAASLAGGLRRFRFAGLGYPSRMAYYAPSATRSRPGFSLLFVVYLVIGGIVAATHHYWSHIHSLKAIGSALLATVLWPLVLIGINLHIH